MEWIQLIGGFVLLLLGGEFLVRGGVSIARKFNVSPLVIGLTVVAFGTSAPELLVSVNAAILGHPEISIGNVVGSNIANIALILGSSALIHQMLITSETIKFDIPILMLASLLFASAATDGEISRVEGIAGLICLMMFLLLQIRNAKKDKEKIKVEDMKGEKTYPLFASVLIVIASCFALSYGADLLIDGASAIARDFGVSERIIAVSIVALGTSLPELVTSIIAAIKKESDLAVGNIVGSNIFNIFCIIGVSATITPIRFAWSNFSFDFVWMLALTLLMFVLILVKKPYDLNKIGGTVLLLSYIVYMFLVL